MIHESNAQRFLGPNHFARQTKFVRHTLAAKPRQPLCSAVTRKNAKFHFRLPQLRGLARNSNRARQRNLASTAKRESIDRANGWLAQRLQQTNYSVPE